MNIPRLYYECQILSSDGKGRYKIKFLENGFTPDVYIQAIQTSEGDGKEGEHGKYGEDDIVLLSFKDYPQSQKPFIVGKLSTEAQRYDSSEKSTIMWKNHTIVFSDDSVEISNSSGIKLVVADSSISLEGGSFTQFNFDLIDLIKTFNEHIHVGNLGYGVAPTLTLLPVAFNKVSVE